MTLKGHYALCFKTRASFGAHCKNFNEDIDLYCQRQRCSLVTLVISVNIRFVPIFEGVHWREGVKRQWGNRKHGFSRLSTLQQHRAVSLRQHGFLVIQKLLTSLKLIFKPLISLITAIVYIVSGVT